MKRIILLLTVMFMVASATLAQTPPYYNNDGYGGQNSFPLNTTTSNKVQWLTGPNQFWTGGTGVGTNAYIGLIDTLWLKAGTTTTGTGPGPYTGLEVSFAQNQGTATAFTGTTYVTGLTSAFAPAGTYSLGPTTAGQWYPIPLTTPFLYNPALSLVIEVKQNGYTQGVTTSQSGPTGWRMWGGYTATTGSTGAQMANMGFSLASNLTCATPTALTISNLAQTTLDLSWTDNNTPAATTWEIEYGISGFTPTGTPTLTTTTNPHSFTGLTQNTSYDFYVRAYCGPNDSSYYTAITATTLATCPWPTAQTATGVTANSAIIDWTENGTATAWDVEIGLSGFTPSGTPTFPVTSKPFTIPGLPSNTCFDYYVRSDCGAVNGQSVWTGPFTFCTTIAPLACPGTSNASIVYEEEFTNSFTGQTNIPNAAAPGWTKNGTSTGNPRWALESNGTGSGSTGPNAGAQGSQGYAYMEVSCVSGGSDTLTSPLIDLSGAVGAARVKFFNHMYGANSGKLELFVDNGTTLTSVWVDSGQTHTSSDVTADPWDSAVVNLNAYVGQSINLRFVGTAANPGGCAGDRGLDQISIEACVACAAPSGLVASNITATSADLNWTENGSATAWDLEVVPTNATPTGTPTNAGVTTGGTATPYTLTGLTLYTAVDVYVRAACGGTSGNSSWIGPVTILPCAPLAGTYTIDPASAASATNFQSFTDAAFALQCGISAPVVFDVSVASSPYNEQIVLPQVMGSSPTNTITFNGNGSTITAATTSTDYAVVRLDGTDYTRWNDLTVSSTSTTNAMSMHLLNSTNATTNNVFTNCTFEVPITATSSLVNPFAMSGSATSPTTACAVAADSNIIDSCTIRGGYYTIAMYGGFAAADYGNYNAVTNCTIEDYYYYASYMLYQNNFTFKNNDISRPTRTTLTTHGGVYASGLGSNNMYEQNRIHDVFGSAPTSTSTFYGFYFFIDASSAANSNVIQNNLIEDIEGNGTHYGIYFSTANNLKVYHNTVVFDNTASTGGTTRGIYQAGTTALGQDIQNNNVYITRGGTGTNHGIWLDAAAAQLTCDYNNVYVAGAGTNYYGENGGNQLDLTAWQASTPTVGANSLDVDPLFVAIAPDYSPSNPAMNSQGAALGVTEDFTGATRPATGPDMGAFEFSVSATDMATTAILSPNATVGCYTATETVDVEVTNYGSALIDFSTNPMTVTAEVTGTVTATLTATINTGTLAPLASLTVPVTPTINMTANGTYTITAHATTTGDAVLSNDTLATPVVYNVNLVAGTTTATPDLICLSDNVTLDLAGNAGGSIQWQESTVGGNGPWTNIGTGTSPYTLPAAVTQTTYYRAVLTCNSATDSTAVDTVIVNNPMIATTTNDTICGPNSATLGATIMPGANYVNWYADATSTTVVDTGNVFATPVLSATDTFYAAANAGGGSDTAGISAWNYNYSGASRGGWFVAQSDYVITELQVPLEANGTHQSLVILKMNATTTPPSGTGYTIMYETFNNPTTGYIPVNIPVTTGDVMVMIGNRSGSATATTGTIAYSNSASNVTVDGLTTTYNRTTLGHVNANLTGFTQSISGSNGSVAGMVRFKYATGCAGARVPVIAVVNPSAGNLALATTSNASSTAGNTLVNDMQADGQTLSYYNPTCELVATVADAPGGNVLGAVLSRVTVDPTVQVYNTQPYTRRWFDISPASNGAADVTIYQTQDDFDDYNVYATANGWPLLPTGPTDLAGIANVRVTQVSGGTLGVGTGIVYAPTTTTWDAANMRWELNFPVTGFSEFYVHALNPTNAVLPVGLRDFTAVKNGSVSDASWFTTMEENNSHFNVQRSTDGQSFTTLGTVNSKAANGMSSEELAYAFTDSKPQIGHNYYRLEQVDLDGNKSYSQIIDLVWGADGSVVSIYPNPATDKLNVDVSIDKVTELEVRLIDMSGRVVKSVLQRTSKGMNNVSMNLSEVATGVYGVQVYDNNTLIHTSKVNKQDK